MVVVCGGKAKSFGIYADRQYDSLVETTREILSETSAIVVDGSTHFLNLTTRRGWHMPPTDMNIQVTPD